MLDVLILRVWDWTAGRKLFVIFFQ